MSIKCNYCNEPVDPTESENYEDPNTGKVRIFHRGRCHDEARKDSISFGIDDFKDIYSSGERDKFK